MTNIDRTKIKKMFDYLYNPTFPIMKTDGAIVFGRADPLVARKAAEIYDLNKTGYLLFTGGIGKDSGFLTEFQIPEAEYLSSLAHFEYGVPRDSIYVEPNARNGGECWENSIETIVKNSLKHDDMIIVVHPTSLRRCHAMGQVIGPRKNFEAKYQRVGTRYEFNPQNPIDQKEAVLELLRLADWPEKGFCAKQNDLPEGLVAYARELKEAQKW